MASSGRKVLVCVDGSDIARNAFQWYLNNLWKEGDEVLIATKAEFKIKYKVPLTEKDIAEITEKCKKGQGDVDALLADYADTMRGKKVKGNCQALFGEESAGQLLMEKANEWRANFIVMGTRGLSAFKGMLLGSVSDFVVKHAKCPVIIVRPEES